MDQGPPDALQPLLDKLKETLAVQSKFQPNLRLPRCSYCSSAAAEGEVTVGTRDGTAHVLRCLKVWYEMPSEVLFVALNFLDRFLSKMKARPKHMACIAIACFQMAAELVCQEKVGSPSVPEAKEVANLSQCKCTIGDLKRMQEIIITKLGSQPDSLPITAIDFLYIFHALFLTADKGVSNFYKKLVDADELCQKLEIVVCDANVTVFPLSEVALVVLCIQMDLGANRLDDDPRNHEYLLASISFATFLQKFCEIEDGQFFDCHNVVRNIIKRYNAQQQMPHRQRLVWKLSHRTLRYLRPTNKLVKVLPTITEQNLTRSDSSTSEDSWTEEEYAINSI